MYKITWLENGAKCKLEGDFNSIMTAARVFETNDIDFKVMCLDEFIDQTTVCRFDYKHWIHPDVRIPVRR